MKSKNKKFAEVIKSTSKKDLLNELWVSWTQIVWGFIEEDYRSDLQWPQWVIVYDKMRKSDAQIFATLLVCELPIRQTKWYIESAESEDWKIDTKSKEITDFVYKNLFQLLENTWDDLLREILTMLPFWYSVFEKVYWIKDWMIYLKKLSSRKQTTIQKWETEDWKPWVTQMSVWADDSIIDWKSKSSNISIPQEKLVIFTFRQEWLNYEWASILRSAYKHWYIKDKLYKFDAVRHERQSVWIPLIYLPRNATPDDKLEAQRIVRNVRSTEQTWIVMPWPKEDWWLFEFADTKADKSTDLFESIKHHNREIAKNVLAQFLELWDTQSGSRALWEDQSDLFLLSLWAIANQIRDTFNKNIIPELVDINFDDTKWYYPELKYENLWRTDYNSLIENITKLTSNWILWVDEALEIYIRELLSLPTKQKEEIKKDLKKEDNKQIENKKDLKKEDENFNEDEIFNSKYFEELSILIDEKFIIDLHKNETQ